MQPLLVLLCALALLFHSGSAAPGPLSPRTSLQSRQQRREVFASRQATKAAIVRREKRGPRKRVDASPVACGDTLGANKIIDGDFESEDNAIIWPRKMKGDGIIQFEQGKGYPFSETNTAFSIGGTSGNSFTLSQTFSLCASELYTLRFDVGANSNAGDGCDLYLQLNSDQGQITAGSYGVVCREDYQCTTANADNTLVYAVDQEIQFLTPPGTTEGTLRFTFTCARTSTGTTYFDNIKVVRGLIERGRV